MKTKQWFNIVAPLLLVWLAVAPDASAFYNPSAGRWLNRDPLDEPGQELLKEAFSTHEIDLEDLADLQSDEDSMLPMLVLSGGLSSEEVNPYAFVFNNPFGYFDPNGEAAAAVGGGAVVVGGGIIARHLIKKEIQRRAKRAAECAAIHKLYSETQAKARACKPGMSAEDAARNCALWSAVVAGRSLYLSKKCDYYLPGSIAGPGGSKKAEAGHKEQLATTSAAMLTCYACALPDKK